MRKRFPWVVVFLAGVLLNAPAGAQQGATPAPAPTYYASTTYIKVLPGQGAAYRTWMTNTSKKFYQELMSAEPNFVHWDCAQNLYRAMDQDFDYACVTVTVNSPLDPARDNEPIYKKLGTTGADYQAKLASLRTVVANELLRRMAGTSATSTGTAVEGSFRVMNQQKVAPGMMDEFTTRTTTLLLPVNQDRVKSGGTVTSWSMWTRVFPAGAATDYDVLGVTTYKTMASALGTGGDPNAAATTFLRVHPTESFAAYTNNGRDYSTSQRRLMTRVVVLVERNATGKTSQDR